MDNWMKPQKKIKETAKPIKLFKDSDKDGVANVFDCSPRNKKKQDINSVMAAVKARAAQLASKVVPGSGVATTAAKVYNKYSRPKLKPKLVPATPNLPAIPKSSMPIPMQTTTQQGIEARKNYLSYVKHVKQSPKSYQGVPLTPEGRLTRDLPRAFSAARQATAQKAIQSVIAKDYPTQTRKAKRVRY